VGWHVAPKPSIETESLGRRIADHRAKLGLTQQELAERVGISRVAVSHIESGVTDPGERTVTLLAGLFKLQPHELVAATTYPAAKADRLPLVTAHYTEVEHQLALLDNDLDWLEREGADDPVSPLEQWRARLGLLADETWDPRERRLVASALQRVGRRLASISDRSEPATRRADR
jgi:transcriptional regulator with XRE-family HTH domain